ncbi:hypothetical protein MKW92_016403 [Papaver armeniacum]|nr:hypothetical protein MKW92_016403 [Papaver armeniacum]
MYQQYHNLCSNAYTSRQVSEPGSNPTDDPFDLLADVEATAMDELMDCFHKFQLRSNVDIENVSENFLSSDLKEEPEASALGWGAGVDKAGQSSAEGNSSGWKWYNWVVLVLGEFFLQTQCTIG